jgi:putative spermidine/putrescine transport system permease protein
VSAPALRDPRAAGRWILNAAAGLSLGFIVLPLVFVIWLAFFKNEIVSFPPEGYTFRWFRAIFDQGKFVDGFIVSTQIGIVATAIGIVLAVPAALAISRHRFPAREWANTLLLLPLVVPGVVLGTSIYVFHIEAEIATELPILGSLTGLIFAHVLVVIPWCVRLITASLAGLDRTTEEAAQNLGATPLVTFFRVTLPAIRPGIVAGALFGFVTSFGNLEMSLFLVGPGRTTLPIAILQYLEWKLDPTIAAVSVLQILIIGGAMVVTDHYVKLARVV